MAINNKVVFNSVQDAFSKMYMPTGEVALQNGYISRIKDPLKGRVYEARGKRKGQLYYLEPNWKSTRYCYRVYLKKEDSNGKV